MICALLGLTATACLAGGGAGGSAPFAVSGAVAPAAERQVRPDLTGTTLTGRQLDVAAWRGHVVVVNTWGSWCAPCRKEAPELARAAARTAGVGVRFLGINVRDNRASAIAFERNFGIGYPSLFDPGDTLKLEFGPLQVPAVPYTYVLDGQGRVAARFIGRTTVDPLFATIESVRTGVVPPR